MFWAAIAYASGIVAGAYLWRPASWLVAAGMAFLAAGLYFVARRKWLGAALALAVFFLAGALHIELRGPTSPLDTSLQPFCDGQQVVMTAHVTREGRLREGNLNEASQSLDVETEEIIDEFGKRTAVLVGVRLGIYSTNANGPALVRTGLRTSPTLRVLRYGECIRLPVKLKLPRNFRNPGAFDYQGYLAANGIAALGSAQAEDVPSAARLHRRSSRTLANPHSLEHYCQGSCAMAAAPSRADRCHGHW
jgi:hypothetical protein